MSISNRYFAASWRALTFITEKDKAFNDEMHLSIKKEIQMMKLEQHYWTESMNVGADVQFDIADHDVNRVVQKITMMVINFLINKNKRSK